MAFGSNFSGVSTRNNGERVMRTWWNDLKTAGVALEASLSAWLGAGQLAGSQSLANNQAATNVTGLVLDKATYKSALVMATIRRKTDSNSAVVSGTFVMQYDALLDTWVIAGENFAGATDPGVTLSITSAGQVQYATDNMAGTNYSGTMTFKALQID